jgi:hypothetical protein
MSWYFTEEEKDYLRTHYLNESMYQMAENLKRPKASIHYHLKTILKLRVPGEVHIKNKAKRKEAAIKKKKLLLKFIKPKKKREQKIRLSKEPLKKQRILGRKNEISWHKKIAPEKQLRIADMSNLIPVRIDHKTTLYVKPGSDVDKILKQYQKQA